MREKLRKIIKPLCETGEDNPRACNSCIGCDRTIKALLKLLRDELPKESYIEFQTASQGLDRHTEWIQHRIDGMNLYRKAVLDMIGGRDGL